MTTFNSRKDLGTFIIYLMITILGFLVFLYALIEIRNATGWRNYTSGIFFGLIGIATPLAMLLAMLKTTYTFDDTKITLKSGFFKTSIDYSRIYIIKDSNRFFALYSLSLQRLEISYKDPEDKSKEWSRVFVSPTDKDAFIKELKKHCKSLKVVRLEKAEKR